MNIATVRISTKKKLGSGVTYFAEFLGVIGATLREGRGFSEPDRANTQPVLIVNETFANRHWPRESALGKGIQINHRQPNDPWLTIVGVVKEIRERGIEPELKPAMYMPHAHSANEMAHSVGDGGAHQGRSGVPDQLDPSGSVGGR